MKNAPAELDESAVSVLERGWCRYELAWPPLLAFTTGLTLAPGDDVEGSECPLPSDISLMPIMPAPVTPGVLGEWLVLVVVPEPLLIVAKLLSLKRREDELLLLELPLLPMPFCVEPSSMLLCADEGEEPVAPGEKTCDANPERCGNGRPACTFEFTIKFVDAAGAEPGCVLSDLFVTWCTAGTLL